MYQLQPMRHTRPLLGSYVEMIANAPPKLAERGVSAAFAELKHVHQQMNFHDAESDLSRINLYAWKRPVSISPSTLRVLCFARQLARQTDGLFDFTTGGCLVREGRLPDHGFCDLYARGWDALLLLPRLRVRFKRPLVLHLDGIVKGYAVDQAVRILLSQGITSGLVNAGGELRLFGKGQARINLRESNGSLTALGAWSNTAMATSAQALAVENPTRLPACMVEQGGCDGLACPHFTRCPHAWTTVVAQEAWRASGLNTLAHAIPLKERAARIAKLGGRLITDRTTPVN